jgi:hypothetical protein
MSCKERSKRDSRADVEWLGLTAPILVDRQNNALIPPVLVLIGECKSLTPAY